MDSQTALHRAMGIAERKVGGGEGFCGVNGTVNAPGMHLITTSLLQHCSLNAQSIVVDVGSALGKPLFHLTLISGATTYGIEMDEVKCHKALAFARVVREVMQRHDPAIHLKRPAIICSTIEEIRTLKPATIMYAAWEGFSEKSKEATGRLFAASETLKAVAIVQRVNIFGQRDPAEEMRLRGFGAVRLVAMHSVQLEGGTKLRAYVFVKVEVPAGDDVQRPIFERPVLAVNEPASPVVGKRRRSEDGSSGSADCKQASPCEALHLRPILPLDALPRFMPLIATQGRMHRTRGTEKK